MYKPEVGNLVQHILEIVLGEMSTQTPLIVKEIVAHHPFTSFPMGIDSSAPLCKSRRTPVLMQN